MGILRYIIFGVLLLCGSLMAQLSPGELSEPHKDLEGITNCTNCHELGEGPSAEKCLECHTTLRERINTRAGYHYKIVKQEGIICFECHNEHAGRDFNLVTWENGMENFDHSRTGFVLKGKHTKQKCRDCHHPGNMQEDFSGKQDVSAIRTFLGLQQNCISCHVDEHRGQLSKNCESCHNQNNWKKENRFNHNDAKFKLTGKHKEVTCTKCHPTLLDTEPQLVTDTTYLKFVGLNYRNCTSCHKDKHQGKFGNDCTRCHVTDGWKILDERNVDHSKTNFPLLGKHASATCDKCHKPGVQFVNSQYDQCLDCHTDEHEGQFANRSDKGACESCHNVNGFLPPLFAVSAHNKETEFKLTGAHLAQPCAACHRMAENRNGKLFRKFTSDARLCKDCHYDPHMAQFVNSEPPKQCDKCHNVDAWKPVQFDHNKDSRYQLLGAHKKVRCDGCHKSERNGTEQFVRYKPLATECRSCHGNASDSLLIRLEES